MKRTSLCFAASVFGPAKSRARALSLASLLLTSAASAATFTVNSISALQTRINSAVAGDTIIVQNGNYTTTAPISVNRVGAAGNPIVITTETIGGVTIGGSNGFSFSSPAAFIEVEGFVFTHASSIGIPTGTNHIKLTRNVIQLTIPAGSDVSYINISGDDVEIDHNELRNKSTLGEMLDIAGGGTQVARRLWVHHNYFHDFTSPGGNGAETIRWGLSGLSLSTGNGLCEYNLFARCNGENEMISNKSSGNTYRFNTVLDCPGGEISQRHGDNCQYYGNYMRNTSGIRIYGDNHQIFSNYIENGAKGIDIGNGDGDVHAGDPLTSHDRPDSCVITFNTLINNTIQYQMGGRTGGLGATNTTFANNIIQGGGPAASISSSAPYTTPTWSGNIVWNTTAGSIPSGGFSNVNPLLAPDANGIQHIQAGSPAIDSATGTYAAVTIDQDGQPRSGAKDKGADEFSSAAVTAAFLTPTDVGPSSGLAVPADAPTFSPAAGTYTGTQSVSISSSAGATLRYTTDGSTPSSTAGTVYTAPVGIAANTTLKAIAFGSGFIDSPVTTGVYAIRVGAPVFSPPPGNYSAAVSLALSSATSGASIRYTTDGSNPSPSIGILYSGSITLSTTTTIKAIAFKAGLTDSVITSGTYTITPPPAAAPVFSPAGGTFSTAQNVAITSATSGASIRYTTDGSTPTSTAGTPYSGPVPIDSTTTLKAIAFGSGLTDSAVTSATYTINDGSVTVTSADGFVNTALSAAQSGSFTAQFDATPSISPSNTNIGLCSGAQTAYTGMAVAVRFSTTGNIDARNGGAFAASATIPFSAGVKYHFRLVVNVPAHTYSVFVTPAGGAEQTLGTAFAFRTEQAGVTSLNTSTINVNATPGGSVKVSPVVVSTVPQVAAPVFNPVGGSFTTPQTVTITSSTSGATLRYTVDGSTPTSTTGTVYTGPLTINATTTVKAIAFNAGMTDSTVTSATFTITSANVTITSADGFVNTALSASQSGTFTAQFNASPSLSPSNAIVALSQGAQTAYTGMAVAVRFNPTGTIDARNGGAFAASTTIPFSAGSTYHFRLVVNVAAHTYSIFVTPPGGSELTLGTNFAFRTEQAGVTSLNTSTLNVNATPGGSMTVGAITISP
jgi:hypothetical protein